MRSNSDYCFRPKGLCKSFFPVLVATLPLVMPGCQGPSAEVELPDNPTPLPTDDDIKQIKGPTAPSRPDRKL